VIDIPFYNTLEYAGSNVSTLWYILLLACRELLGAVDVAIEIIGKTYLVASDWNTQLFLLRLNLQSATCARKENIYA